MKLDYEKRVSTYRLVFHIGTFLIILTFLISFRKILIPFIIAIVIAYILYPIVEWVQKIKIKGYAIPRWVAVLTVYIILLGLFSFIFTYFIPLVVKEAKIMMEHIPEFFYKIKQNILPKVNNIVNRGFKVDTNFNIGDIQFSVDINSMIQDTLNNILERSQSVTISILKFGEKLIINTIRFIFGFFLTLMLSVFIVIDAKKIINFIRSLFPPTLREEFDIAIERINRGLSGVIRGQFIICIINGILSGIGFYIADLKYWPFFTLIATIFTLIPIFGTIISSTPAILVGLTQSFGTGLFVFLWIVGIHQLEANLLNPKIMQASSKIHPVLVVFALMAGAYIGGLLGALLGVPLFSILQSLFLYLRERAYPRDE